MIEQSAYGQGRALYESTPTALATVVWTVPEADRAEFLAGYMDAAEDVVWREFRKHANNVPRESRPQLHTAIIGVIAAFAKGNTP